ncbi:unnamed protein product, partial [marine sediment metagenome]
GYGGVLKHVELEKEEIKPCPFCGSADIAIENTHTALYWMECQNCGAQVDGKNYGDLNDDESHLEAARSALATWNHRA